MKYLLSAAVGLGVALLLSGCKTTDHGEDEKDPTGMTEEDGSEHSDGEHDGAEPEMASTVNDMCPLMGQPVKASIVAEFQGKNIGFCCNNCLKVWEDMSDDEKAEKVAGL